MYLNDDSPIAGGREIWGFPKKLAEPSLRGRDATRLLGTLDYGPVRVATGTMGYKHRPLDLDAGQGVARGAELPAEDHPARRLPVRGSASWSAIYLEDVILKGAWTGPAGARTCEHHALAPVGDLPVREILSAVHIMTDLTPRTGRGRARLPQLLTRKAITDETRRTRSVIVTGAARGIGEGIAKRYVEEGARVAIADLDGDKAEDRGPGACATGPKRASASP